MVNVHGNKKRVKIIMRRPVLGFFHKPAIAQKLRPGFNMSFIQPFTVEKVIGSAEKFQCGKSLNIISDIVGILVINDGFFQRENFG